MLPEEQVCDLNDCRHLYHADCLNKWLENKNECPLCKKPLDIYQANPVPNINALFQNVNAAQLPFEQYFRNILEVHQNMQVLQDLQLARNLQDGADRNIDREFQVAFLAIQDQFRTVQRNMIRQRALEQAIRAAAVNDRVGFGVQLDGVDGFPWRGGPNFDI